MLGERGVVATRWITVRAGARVVALSVADVIGMRRLAQIETDASVPPLLANAARGAIDALAVLDGELLVVLRAARLLNDEVWASIERSTPELALSGGLSPGSQPGAGSPAGRR
jgi:purine-binding chemotaxis protein CheW